MNETKTFDSFEQFLTAACGPSEMSDALRSSRKTEPMREKFTGTRDFAAALDLARNGWPEGAAQVKAVAASIREKLSGSLTERQIAEWSVTGADVDVGRFVIGEPECMIDFVPDTVHAPAKFLRMTVNFMAACGIPAEEIIRKGAAAVALIDALESSGYRVEVDGVVANGFSDIHKTVIRLKNAGEPCEIDRLAFAIAHPSTFRRLFFSYMETLPANWRAALHVPGGYGHVRQLSAEDAGDINIEALRFGTEAASAEWILGQLRGQGIALAQTEN